MSFLCSNVWKWRLPGLAHKRQPPVQSGQLIASGQVKEHHSHISAVSKFLSPRAQKIGPGAQQFLAGIVRKNQFEYYH